MTRIARSPKITATHLERKAVVYIRQSTLKQVQNNTESQHNQRALVERAFTASLDEIRAVRASTDAELELFVHGALCVSYSGQCFSSEAWGWRSANRGQCAQACRLPYEMLVDGRVEPLGDARYLLSRNRKQSKRIVVAQIGFDGEREFGQIAELL